ncbi:non-specific serine/threonine protein kinase [Ranunculus cassubicifolius]
MLFIKIMCLVLLEYAAFSSGNKVSKVHHHLHRSLFTDKAALLAFRKATTPSRQSALVNWNEDSDVCNFTGVTCDQRHRHRVVKLMLSDSNIQGLLPPIVANLTALRVLDLSNNNLFGPIPTEISYLRFIRFLRLDGNLLDSEIPESLSFLSRLRYVHLGDNQLTGIIPPSIFINCTSLRYLDFSINYLTGKIPPEVEKPPELWCLNLYLNDLSGEIPISLSNVSNLVIWDVENNHLSGDLPSQVVAKLNLLESLHLSYNHFVTPSNNTNLEPFLVSLANCTELVELELAGMGLGGRLPNSVDLLATTLSIIHLEDNRFFGVIPPNVGNLFNLTLLNLSSNLLKGTIPVEIGQLKKLEQLILSNNALSGGIPAILSQIRSMGLLDLSRNNLTGEVPASLGDLSLLTYLFLNNNKLSGEIPPGLGQCRDLHKLDLSYNRLSGKIPPEISGLSEIRIFFNVSHNSLHGPLPYEISKLASVQEIDLSSNNLSGIIFPQLSGCIAVTLLNLSHNSFQGLLPESLGELQNLVSLDVSNNHLVGVIPESLSLCPSLAFLNLSYNSFSGPIPGGGIFNSITNLTFLGNKLICGSVSGISYCPKKTDHSLRSRKYVIKVSAAVSASVFLATICSILGYRFVKGLLSLEKDELNRSEPELKFSFPRMTYKELSDATKGFDQGKLVGSGGYGQVYRGALRDGTAVAIKVLRLQTGNSTKSFSRECEVLKRIRHRNLMRIITACSLPDFKALVLPFMSNGSLDSHLYPHPETGSSDLSLIQRVNICSDIAEGMAYLHHHSPVKVIHCDLKPSNILLNDDMTALVSDFGIARLVMTVGMGNSLLAENVGNSTTNIVTGSIGYIAPEYGFGSNTSIKGDVYSFGVVVLEMVTRKRPTDDLFIGDLSLHRWVKNHYHGRVEKVIDSSLIRATRNQSPEVTRMWEVGIGELVELGLLCTQEAPSTRPTMLDAADDLDRLKSYLNGDTTATFASSLGISSSTISDDW